MIYLPLSHSVLIIKAHFLLEQPVTVFRSNPFIHRVFLLAGVSCVSITGAKCNQYEFCF